MQIFDPDFRFLRTVYAGDYIIEIAEMIYKEKSDTLKDSDRFIFFKTFGEKI